MARDCRKKTEYLQINRTSGWFDTDTKGKPSTGKGKGKQDKGKGKDKLGKGKFSSKNSEKDNNTARKGRTDFHEMEGHEDTQETKTGQENTEWTYTSWDDADNWTDEDCWSSEWSTDLWNDPAWEQAARQLSPTQPAQEQANPTHRGNISMSGGLTMCELSVDDELGTTK